MKSTILKLLVFALAATATLVVFTEASHARKGNGRGATPQTTATAPQEKTVEQVQKNIKVLNGLPQSQLIPVMNFFSASLGRRCNFCHVNNNGQWDYAADTKPEKNTAREMIKMVLDVNKSTFKGSTEVSCYTCHRGRNQPQALPTLPLALPSPPPNAGGGTGPGAGGAQPQASPTPRPALPSADDIFNKYIAALGGQQAIDKLKSRVAKGTLVQSNGNTLQFELYQVAPDKFYQLVTTQQGPFERGFNGTVGWEKSARGVREITGGDLAQLRAANSLFGLIKLKEQFTRTRVTGKDKIGDREVYVINGTTTDDKRQRLFFDVETGLLLRRVTYTPTIIGVIPEQVDFEDYQEVDGIKFPFTARTSTIELGNPVSTRKFTEIKLSAPVDESKFKMPAAPPSNP
jgi:photosynthetic reaction center cytochrome c subunit